MIIYNDISLDNVECHKLQNGNSMVTQVKPPATHVLALTHCLSTPVLNECSIWLVLLYNIAVQLAKI